MFLIFRFLDEVLDSDAYSLPMLSYATKALHSERTVPIKEVTDTGLKVDT